MVLPLELAVAAHEAGHFFDALEGERRAGYGLHGKRHKFHGIVVCRDAVGA